MVYMLDSVNESAASLLHGANRLRSRISLLELSVLWGCQYLLLYCVNQDTIFEETTKTVARYIRSGMPRTNQ